MYAPTNSPRKPELELPQGYAAFTRTPTFDPLKLPAGLRDSHSTSRGVWGEIVVEQGTLRYDWLDGSGKSWNLEVGEVGVIPDALPHRVKPLSDDTRFHLQLYRAEDALEESSGQDIDGRAVLDVRPLPAPLRHREIFSAFDALGPGESLIFINDHDPRPLLGQFAILRRHRYLWLPQSATGERWTVCLCSRQTDSEPTVGEALLADHVRLDELMNSAANAAAADKPAAEILDDFSWGLRRHIRIEEQRLFPLFVEAGGPVAPTQVMALEHRGIEQKLQLLENSPQSALSTLDDLRRMLEQHNFKEEGVLYPMLDDLMGERHAELVEAVFRELG